MHLEPTCPPYNLHCSVKALNSQDEHVELVSEEEEKSWWQGVIFVDIRTNLSIDNKFIFLGYKDERVVDSNRGLRTYLVLALTLQVHFLPSEFPR